MSKGRGSRKKSAVRVDLPSCGACGTDCEPDISNWFEKDDTDDGKSASGILCYACGTFAVNRGLTQQQLVDGLDGSKVSKRAAHQLMEERNEHCEAQADMDSRKFARLDVERFTVNGTYTEDRRGFQDGEDFKSRHNVPLQATTLAAVSRDFPGNRAQVGILRSDAAATVVAAHPLPAPPGVSIVRFCKEEVIMREKILDGEKAPHEMERMIIKNNCNNDYEYVVIYIMIIYLKCSTETIA